MKIVFATNNQHKLKEVREILGEKFEVMSLNDIGCHEDIEETADTLEGNSMIKTQYIFNKYRVNVFADDTGLEVRSLNGAPGVYSARYAGGEGHDSEANMSKLLRELEGVTDRTAQFRTVITLMLLNGEIKTFEGIVEGKIIEKRRGETGFGYDPIFCPEGYSQTFAEMESEMKNSISHRGRAVEKLAQFLRLRQGNDKKNGGNCE